MIPTAAPNVWPYLNHRTVEQVDRDELAQRKILARNSRLFAYARLKNKQESLRETSDFAMKMAGRNDVCTVKPALTTQPGLEVTMALIPNTGALRPAQDA
jgi:hypothetical protein